MQKRRKLASAIGLLAVAGSIAALGAGPLFVSGSDHLDAPLVIGALPRKLSRYLAAYREKRR